MHQVFRKLGLHETSFTSFEDADYGADFFAAHGALFPTCRRGRMTCAILADGLVTARTEAMRRRRVNAHNTCRGRIEGGGRVRVYSQSSQSGLQDTAPPRTIICRYGAGLHRLPRTQGLQEWLVPRPFLLSPSMGGRSSSHVTHAARHNTQRKQVAAIWWPILAQVPR